MNKLRHPVGALVIIAVLLTLTLDVYYNFQEGYGFTETGKDANNMNILEELKGLNLLDAVATYTKAIDKIATPNNPLDFVGGLLLAGLGVLKTIAGIITFPVEIMRIVGDFYTIPSIISTGIGLLFEAYIFFIILSATLGRDI